MIEASWIAFAFVLGLVARSIGLPPLIGYLGAGFALAAAGERIGVGPDDSEILQHLAHLGVLLLLFTVGLKLKLSNLARREVIGGSCCTSPFPACWCCRRWCSSSMPAGATAC